MPDPIFDEFQQFFFQLSSIHLKKNIECSEMTEEDETFYEFVDSVLLNAYYSTENSSERFQQFYIELANINLKKTKGVELTEEDQKLFEYISSILPNINKKAEIFYESKESTKIEQVTISISLSDGINGILKIVELYKNSFLFWWNNYYELFDDKIDSDTIPYPYALMENITENLFSIGGFMIPLLGGQFKEKNEYTGEMVLSIGTFLLYGGFCSILCRHIGSRVGKWWPIGIPVLSAALYARQKGYFMIPLGPN